MSAPNEVSTSYTRALIRVKARQLARRPGFSRSDQDDIEQNLRIYVWCAANRFDPARASFKTFVARVVDSAIAMLIRERWRQKRAPLGDVLVESLEETVDQLDGPPLPLWATISPRDQDRRTGAEVRDEMKIRERVEEVEHAIRQLPVDLQDVCRRLMHRNRTRTARELGLSRRKFSAAIATIRTHFEQSGLGEY